MNRRISHLIGGWRTGLSRPVLILQAGNAFNYFGYGIVLPFEIIYLHQARGFSTSTAGLVLAATMGTAAIVTPPTGALLDRYSAKALVIAGNIVLLVVGHTFFSNILPPFAKTYTPLGPAAIGILFLANTSFVVIAQIPAVRVVARMRRTHGFAGASAIFAVSPLSV